MYIAILFYVGTRNSHKKNVKKRNRLNMAKLTDEFIKAVFDYLLIEETALAPADVGMVFGSKYYSDHLAKRAADLYHQGYFPKIVVSGGVGTLQDGRPEAHFIRDLLVNEYDVPADAIYVEDQATNTQENIELTQQTLDRELGLENVSSMITMGQVYAGRRYMMTLKRRWPEVFAMASNVNAFDVATEDWPQNERLKELVLAEWGKLDAYFQNDFIREIDLDEIKAKADTLQQEGRGQAPQPKP